MGGNNKRHADDMPGASKGSKRARPGERASSPIDISDDDAGSHKLGTDNHNTSQIDVPKDFAPTSESIFLQPLRAVEVGQKVLARFVGDGELYKATVTILPAASSSASEFTIAFEDFDSAPQTTQQVTRDKMYEPLSLPVPDARHPGYNKSRLHCGSHSEIPLRRGDYVLAEKGDSFVVAVVLDQPATEAVSKTGRRGKTLVKCLGDDTEKLRRRNVMFFMFASSPYRIDRNGKAMYPSLAAQPSLPVSGPSSQSILASISPMSNEVRWVGTRSVRPALSDATTDGDLRAVRQTNGVYNAGTLRYINMSRNQLFSWKGDPYTGERSFSLLFGETSRVQYGTLLGSETCWLRFHKKDGTQDDFAFSTSGDERKKVNGFLRAVNKEFDDAAKGQRGKRKLGKNASASSNTRKATKTQADGTPAQHGSASTLLAPTDAKKTPRSRRHKKQAKPQDEDSDTEGVEEYQDYEKLDRQPAPQSEDSDVEHQGEDQDHEKLNARKKAKDSVLEELNYMGLSYNHPICMHCAGPLDLDIPEELAEEMCLPNCPRNWPRGPASADTG